MYPSAPAVITIKSTTLPYVSLTWTSEDTLVAAGHDCQPVLFQNTGEAWKAIGSLDDTTAPKSASVRGSTVGRLNSAAFNTFRNAAERGISNNPGSPTTANSGESELFTVHQNTITSVRPYAGQPGAVAQVSTSGVDGKLVVWDANAVTPVTAAGLAGKMGRMGMR